MRDRDVTTPDHQWFGEHGARRRNWIEKRHELLRGVRAFFDRADFVEVETPLVVPSPGLDLHLAAFEVPDAARNGGARYLITSPEYQMKRLLSGGFERIYQLCKCFRREELGDHHEPEFTMLEWYRADAGSGAVMADTEQLVESLAVAICGTTQVPGTGGGTVDVRAPWPRMTVDDAFRAYVGRSMWDVLPDEEAFFRAYVDHIEPNLGNERPVFLVEWPASMASLARLLPHNPKLADRFEAYVGGVELCNGFGELTDPAEQRARLLRDPDARRAAGKPVYPLDERFLAALEAGIPPSAGNALGIDRLLAFLLAAPSIQDIIAIPNARCQE